MQYVIIPPAFLFVFSSVTLSYFKHIYFQSSSFIFIVAALKKRENPIYWIVYVFLGKFFI